MTQSDITQVLQSQTQRKVALLTRETVRQGSTPLREVIDGMRLRCNYLILDVTDQTDLATIAGAVYDEPVLCGSSALAEELPPVWGAKAASEERLALAPPDGAGILCAAGSLMPQTRAQIEHFYEGGALRVQLDVQQLFEPLSREAEFSRLTGVIVAAMLAGQDVVFHSPNDPDALEATLRAGSKASLSRTEIAGQVSSAVAEVTARVLEQTRQNRLLVAGGETSAAVCERLGIRGMRVWQEICPGLPSCVSLSEPAYLLVLKSGSFGAPDFFRQAVEHLRAQ